MKGKLAAAVGASIVALGLGTSSFAAQLLDFRPDPISPELSEVEWVGNTLTRGPGSVADGTILNLPGLAVQTPFVIPGLPGAVANGSSTTFYDVTLELTGLGASMPATLNPVPITDTTSINVLTQPFSSGTFKLWSTGAEDTRVLLLSGNIAGGVIVGVENQQTASAQAGSVAYTDGAILTSLLAAGGSATGSFSWSLISSALGLSTGQGGFLAPQSWNATGVFSTPVIPEPASLSLLALGGLALLRRTRKA